MINESTQWQLKGSSPRVYDEYIVPAVSAPWYPLLLKTGKPYLQGRVVDIGCGTGTFLKFLMDKQSESNETQFFGVDLNAEMLAQAQWKTPTSSKKVSWIKADVEDLPFPDAYFNLVYCQQAVQYFKDKTEALKEIYRTMAPNAVLIATVWSSIEECVGYKCLADAVLQTLGDSTEASLYAPFSYFNPEILKTTVEAIGFKSVSVQVVSNFVSFPSIKNFVWHRVYGSPLINNLPKNIHEQIINKIVEMVESSLKSYEGKDGLVFPVKANYLIAKK